MGLVNPRTESDQVTLQAALQAAARLATAYVPPAPRSTALEAEVGVLRAQEIYRNSKDFDRDLLAELLTTRRIESARE
jgi:hypothetical protein